MNWPDSYIVPGANLYHQEEAGLIYLGDCRDILPHLPKVDLVLTDPPYGIKMSEGFGGFGGFGTPIARRRYKDKWDEKRPPKQTFDEILRIGRNIIIFGGQFYTDYLPQGNHWLVWDKLNTMPSFGDCELCWTNIKRNSVKKLTREFNGLLGKEETRLHPTQKPLNLIKKIIETYLNGGIVLDPFLGSGTTAVAAKELGRRFIGIEIEEKYCEIAVKRLRQGVLNFA